MRVTTNLRTLRDGLAIVGRAVSKKPNNPILAGVLLVWNTTADADASLRALEACDYGLSVRVGPQGDGDMITVVDYDLLTKTLAALPSTAKTITVAVVEDQSPVMTIHAGRITATLPLMVAEEWPDTRQRPTTMRSAPGWLQRAIGLVLPATAPDDTRPVLKGVHVVVEDARMVVEASDGYRAHRVTCDHDARGIDGRIDVIVPRAAAAVLAGLPVIQELGITDGALCVVAGDITLWTSTVGGTFPTLERIVAPSRSAPSHCQLTETALDELASALRLALLYTPQVRGWMRGRFTLDRDGLQVTAEHDGRWVSVPIEVTDIVGPQCRTALQLQFVQDALKAGGGMPTELRMGPDMLPPCLTTPLGVGAVLEVVIMPMTGA